MKPPVEAPTSRQSSPATSSPKASSACGELLAAARDEAGAGGDLELRALVDLLARLRMSLHAAGEHERLRLRAALGQPALDEQHVQALLGAHGESVPRDSPGELSEMQRGPGGAAPAHAGSSLVSILIHGAFARPRRSSRSSA